MNFIIDFEQDATQNQIDQYLADNALTVVQVYSHFDNVYLVSGNMPQKTNIVTSIIDDDATPLQLLVDIVDDAPTFSFDSNEMNWWKLYSLRKADYDAPSISMKRKGKHANVYLLDSGVDITHPEFEDAVIENLYSVTGTFDDSTGHGTAMASLIVGKTCAISDPKLKVVKIFDSHGEVKQSQLLAAMDSIINDVSANPGKLAIANMSWSIPKNEYIETKISIMIAKGVIVVAAAGNSGIPIEQVTPASMDEAITVGAYNQDLQPSDVSNYTGEAVISYTAGATNSGALDGWAPGEQIYVAKRGGGYGFAVGTSVAAAIHSAICAYNGMQLVLADGSIIECGGDFVRMTKDISFARKNLIQYDDPKYNNSVNKISTCFNEFTIAERVPKLTEYINYVAGYPNCVRLFHPFMVKSYEVVGDLPPGLTIYNGTLFGTMQCDEDYKQYEFDTVITTVDDNVINQKVHVLVRKPEFDVNNLPQNDPVLSVLALICFDTSCGAGCASGTHCTDCGGGGKSAICQCLCGACSCE